LSSSPERRSYIDWARGLAVLVMIEAHTLDAWTRAADRHTVAFRNLTVLGGFAAPLFLWLAGVALALSADRTAKRSTRAEAVRTGVRRGLEIFLLAFLFRLQAFVLSPGGPALRLLRVDILNVMGPSLAAAVLLWGLARSPRGAALLSAAAAALMAMATPIVRSAGWVGALPPLVQWYIRPAGDQTTFTLFPWAGFVFAGAAAGVLIARSGGGTRSETRTIAALGAAGGVLMGVGFYTASLPSIYAEASFWTSSPTYFAIRSGLMLVVFCLLFAARALANVWPAPFHGLERLGRHSLFVYWVHVELVYGYATWLIHGRLPIPATLAAYAAFSVLMYAAAGGWERLSRRKRGDKPNSLHLWYLEGLVKNR
jgi:uncharacterized membrane protein